MKLTTMAMGLVMWMSAGLVSVDAALVKAESDETVSVVAQAEKAMDAECRVLREAKIHVRGVAAPVRVKVMMAPGFENGGQPIEFRWMNEARLEESKLKPTSPVNLQP